MFIYITVVIKTICLFICLQKNFKNAGKLRLQVTVAVYFTLANNYLYLSPCINSKRINNDLV